MEDFLDYKGCATETVPKSSGMEGMTAALLSDYMTVAHELQACCRLMTRVKGAQKLERQIGTEIKFFQSLSTKDTATQAAQLQSSNLGHFAAIVHAATHLPGVTQVMQPFTSPDRHHSLEVDVVAHQGKSWVKVVARKGQALHLMWAGQGQFGEKDIVQQLKEYQEVTLHHPVLFSAPTLHALFYNGVTLPVASALQDQGVKVWGLQMPVHRDVLRRLDGLRHEDNEKDEEGEDNCGGSDDLVCDSEGDDDDLVCDGDDGDLVCDGDDFGSVLVCHVRGVRSDTSMQHGSNDNDGRTLGKTSCGHDPQQQQTELQSWCASSKTPFSDTNSTILPPQELASSLSTLTFSSSSEFSASHTTTSLCFIPPSEWSPREDTDIKDHKALGSMEIQRDSALEATDLQTDSVQEFEKGENEHNTRSCPITSERISPCRPYQKMGIVEASVISTFTSAPFYSSSTTSSSSSSSSSSYSSAWKLSPLSQRCLEGILVACPDLTLLGNTHDNVKDAQAGKSSSNISCGDGVEVLRKEGDEGEGSGKRREKVNLDITALITLVSAVCHGDGCRFRFQEKVLDQQAEDERRRPALPGLAAYLRDKDWIVCRTAWSDFNSIVQLLGGPGEKERAAQLLNRLTVVEDQPSARTSNLDLKGKVKERSKAVFGTGDQMQAVTVTANSGFIRSAENQNVSFAVYMHPARALTEMKQQSATRL